MNRNKIPQWRDWTQWDDYTLIVLPHQSQDRRACAKKKKKKYATCMPPVSALMCLIKTSRESLFEGLCQGHAFCSIKTRTHTRTHTSRSRAEEQISWQQKNQNNVNHRRATAVWCKQIDKYNELIFVFFSVNCVFFFVADTDTQSQLQNNEIYISKWRIRIETQRMNPIKFQWGDHHSREAQEQIAQNEYCVLLWRAATTPF